MLEAFEAAEAAISPIYDASDILADPQLDAIGAILSIDDAELGPIKMSNVISRLSETPGEVRHPGGRQGEHTAAVLGELGVSLDELARLRGEGVV